MNNNQIIKLQNSKSWGELNIWIFSCLTYFKSDLPYLK